MNLAWIDIAGVSHAVTLDEEAPAVMSARLFLMAHTSLTHGEHVGATVLGVAANVYRMKAERLAAAAMDE